MKKILLITLFTAFAFGASFAQSNTALTYSIGFPTGDLSDFVQKTSWRGIGFDYRKMIQPNIGIGFNLGWNVFYEEMDRATYTNGNESLTGKQYRYSNHFPMQVTGAYFLRPGETKSPFVGLGLGTMYTVRNTDMNLYTYEQEAWNFLMTPEVGFQFMADDATAIHISAKYNYGFKAGNELDGAQSFISLNIGIAFVQ